VVAFDENDRATSLEEKPSRPRSDWAVIGVYFYDATAPIRAAGLAPSARGEYEITDLNRTYLDEGTLGVERLESDSAWFDAGTHESLLEAAKYVRLVQRRQRQLVGAPEEAAFAAGWIDDDTLVRQARMLSGTEYGRMLAVRQSDARARKPANLSKAAPCVGALGERAIDAESA
jgi:glucose-1-phosphate thymidylyltransferase